MEAEEQSDLSVEISIFEREGLAKDEELRANHEEDRVAVDLAAVPAAEIVISADSAQERECVFEFERA